MSLTGYTSPTEYIRSKGGVMHTKHYIVEKRICSRYGGDIKNPRCEDCPSYKEAYDTVIDWFIDNVLRRLGSMGTVCTRCKYSKYGGNEIISS